jgi:hypothetical protein
MVALFALSTLNSQLSTALAQTTAFTYQGQLRDGGTNANGTYTMIFKLFDDLTSGTQIGSAITNSPALANGLFTVNLDFGAGAFNGNARWLDITITIGATTQTLTPRVQLLSAPYAQFSAVAATVTNGAILNAQLAPNAVATSNIQNGAITDSKLAAVTALAKGAENNLRIVRGVLSSDTGSIVTGSGFSATFFPPGTGGTSIGSFSITQVGSPADYQLTAAGNFTGQIQPLDWLLVGNQILQVQSVSYLNPTTTIRLYGTGCGGLSGTVSVSGHPRLASEWNITFTPAFSSFPAIAVTTHGEDAFFASPQPTVALKRSLSDGGTTFKAVVSYVLINGNGFPGDCPLTAFSGFGFEFIAIGPQ